MSNKGYNQTSAFDVDDDLEGSNDTRQSLDQDYGEELGDARPGNQRLTNEVYPDPVAEKLISLYQGMGLHKNDTLRIGLMASPLVAIVLFYVLIS